MEKHILTAETICAFEAYLLADHREQSTIEKYMRDIRMFWTWSAGKPITKECIGTWKEQLRQKGLQPGTVNSKVSALNKFFSFAGWEDCHVSYLKIQRKLFRSRNKELTREDYSRLLNTAEQQGKKRLCLLLETICATGIRVSEVAYITVEAAQTGRAELELKGKIRTILLPDRLCRKLLKYAKKKKITSGVLFLTRNGKSISRRQIWAEMKALCKKAGVEASKVFPHNLRHLFARTFYRISHDIVKLADLLGHSNMETTRIYLVSTGTEHMRQLERLGLIS